MISKRELSTVNKLNYQLNDLVEMKKPHPCGMNRWLIIRLGADIRIKCTGCEHSVLLARSDFDKKLKQIIIDETNQRGE
jgi:hypothetical protein